MERECTYENASLACMRIAKRSSCMSTMQMSKAISAQVGTGHQNRSKATQSRHLSFAHEIRNQAGLLWHAEDLDRLCICS